VYEIIEQRELVEYVEVGKGDAFSPLAFPRACRIDRHSSRRISLPDTSELTVKRKAKLVLTNFCGIKERGAIHPS